MKLLDLSEGYLRFPPVEVCALDNLEINGFIFLQNGAIYHIQRGGNWIHGWCEWINVQVGGHTDGRFCTVLSHVRSAILELVVVGVPRAPTVICV